MKYEIIHSGIIIRKMRPLFLIDSKSIVEKIMSIRSECDVISQTISTLETKEDISDVRTKISSRRKLLSKCYLELANRN